MLLQIGLNIPWRGWNKMNLLWSNFLFMFFDLYERAPLVPMPFAWSVQVGRSVAKSRMILLDGIGVALQPKGLYWLMICKHADRIHGWDTTSTAINFFISNLPSLVCIMKLALTCCCNPNAWLNMNESSPDRWKTCFHAEIEKKLTL